MNIVFGPAMKAVLALTLTLAQIALCGTSQARECSHLSGDAVFAIHGIEPGTGAKKSVTFNRAEILAMASRKAVMERPWTTSPVEFDGALLAELISSAGVAGKDVSIRALNEYSAKLPVKNANAFSAIVGMKMDGVNYALREGGPLFLLHPIVVGAGTKDHFESYSISKVCDIFVN